MQNFTSDAGHLWLRLLPPASPWLSLNGRVCASRRNAGDAAMACLSWQIDDWSPPSFFTYWRHGHISPCRGSSFHYFRLSICVDPIDTLRSVRFCVSLFVFKRWPRETFQSESACCLLPSWYNISGFYLFFKTDITRCFLSAAMTSAASCIFIFYFFYSNSKVLQYMWLRNKDKNEYGRVDFTPFIVFSRIKIKKCFLLVVTRIEGEINNNIIYC